MEVHLIRHTPVAVPQGMCYGQTDVDVANSFPEDAKAYRESLPLESFDQVFCSPLSRCRKLAAALQIQDLQIDQRLIEMDFGEWEGQMWMDLPTEVVRHWRADFVHVPTPNGECFRDVLSRCKDFMTELSQQNYEKVLLISHSGIIRCVWAWALGIPLHNIFNLPIGFGETLILKIDQKRNRIRIRQKQ